MNVIGKFALSMVAIGTLAQAGGDIEAPQMVEMTAAPVVATEMSGFYAGLGLSAVSAREAGASSSFTSAKDGQDRLGNLALHVGYNINEYLAVEGRYTTSVVKDDISELSGASLFAKLQYPVTEDASVYGLLGFGQMSIDSVVSGSNVDVSESGFQWGLGASMKVTEELAVFVDYTVLANDMDGRFHNANSVDASAVTVGLSYSF